MTSKKWCIAESTGYDDFASDIPQALKAKLSGKFWEIHFENKSRFDLTSRMWQNYCDHGYYESENLSDNLDEAAMRQWLHAFIDRFLRQPMSKVQTPKAVNPS